MNIARHPMQIDIIARDTFNSLCGLSTSVKENIDNIQIWPGYATCSLIRVGLQ